MNLSTFTTLLRELFPIGSSEVRLEFVEALLREGNEPDIAMTLRLITFEDGSIRDIKEQDVRVGPQAILEWHQLEIYFRGYAEALTEVFSQATSTRLDHLLPMDLFPRPFVLKKAQTTDEYRKAFLMKSRLGKLLSA